MRLLNTQSLELSRLYVWREVPDYAIFSHRWNTEEVTYADLSNASTPQSQKQIRNKNGFAKLQGACKQARNDGYAWIWIDSCCIDKSSSSELQEAINSMWRYYAESNMCYAYLADVPDSEAGWGLAFARSQWFTRGWTLQELIAPVFLEFFAENWDAMGTKFQRHKEIAEITSIAPSILLHIDSTAAFPSADKLSWASHRNVTREEDESYSLMGLCNVHMPLLYGEGREQAFARLQEAIFKGTNDHSIFLYRRSYHKDAHPLLASSPTNFCDSVDCHACPPLKGGQDFTYHKVVKSERWQTQAHTQIMTTIVNMFRSETSTMLPLLPYTVVSSSLKYFNRERRCSRATHVAVLNSTSNQHPQGALCLLLRKEAGLDVCSRLRVVPALLPDVGDLEPQLQKTELLVCPGPGALEGASRSDIVFSFNSKSFHVDEWSTKGGSNYSLLPDRSGGHSDFKLQIDKPEKPKTLPEVSCSIIASQGSTLLTISLVRDHKIWSIREIFERKRGRIRRKAPSLFYSATPADRCEIQWPSGKTCSVRLRRLPSSDRSLIASHRYQISLDSC